MLIRTSCTNQQPHANWFSLTNRTVLAVELVKPVERATILYIPIKLYYSNYWSKVINLQSSLILNTYKHIDTSLLKSTYDCRQKSHDMNCMYAFVWLTRLTFQHAFSVYVLVCKCVLKVNVCTENTWTYRSGKPGDEAKAKVRQRLMHDKPYCTAYTHIATDSTAQSENQERKAMRHMVVTMGFWDLRDA